MVWPNCRDCRAGCPRDAGHPIAAARALDMAALRRLAAGYDRLNTTRPVLTKSLTSSLMLGASDIVCQKLVPSPHDAGGGLDVQRAARMASWGLLVNGPIGHLWYLGLERMVRIQGALAIAAKVAIDQLVWTPPLTALFFTYEGCLQGETLDEAKGCAAEKLWPTLKANWVVRRPRQSSFCDVNHRRSHPSFARLAGVASGAPVHLFGGAPQLPRAVGQLRELRMERLPQHAGAQR